MTSPKTITLTKQDFRNFCKAAVDGLRMERKDDDCEHEVYWLCVALCEATNVSNISNPLTEWNDVAVKLYERETK